MPEVTINYLAVITAAVLGGIVMGFIWYGPLFGKQWMRLMGIDQKKMEEMKKGMSKTYGISFVASLIMAYVLAHFVAYTQATTMSQGLQVGFWAWLGFVATTMLASVLYGKKSWQLYKLDAGYQLASLLVMGVILAVWK